VATSPGRMSGPDGVTLEIPKKKFPGVGNRNESPGQITTVDLYHLSKLRIDGDEVGGQRPFL